MQECEEGVGEAVRVSVIVSVVWVRGVAENEYERRRPKHTALFLM